MDPVSQGAGIKGLDELLIQDVSRTPLSGFSGSPRCPARGANVQRDDVGLRRTRPFGSREAI